MFKESMLRFPIKTSTKFKVFGNLLAIYDQFDFELLNTRTLKSTRHQLGALTAIEYLDIKKFLCGLVGVSGAFVRIYDVVTKKMSKLHCNLGKSLREIVKCDTNLAILITYENIIEFDFTHDKILRVFNLLDTFMVGKVLKFNENEIIICSFKSGEIRKYNISENKVVDLALLSSDAIETIIKS
jgi:hypothetical protein